MTFSNIFSNIMRARIAARLIELRLGNAAVSLISHSYHRPHISFYLALESIKWKRHRDTLYTNYLGTSQ